MNATLALPEPQPARRWPRLRTIFLLWMAWSVFMATRSYLFWALFGVPKSPRPIWIVENLLDGCYWAAVTIPILWLAIRFRFTRRGWPLALAVHLLSAVAVSVGSILYDIRLGVLLEGGPPAQFSSYFRGVFYPNLQWYMLLVGCAYLLDNVRRLRDRDVQAAQLGERLAEARLEALKMQIQPHFLFNTLHTISELVYEDPDAAERMIIRLGDLLRLTVDNAQNHEVTLAQEMEFLEAYLEIQRTRFSDRLEVMLNVGADTREALVPNLVLQPLLENAIRHGAASTGGRGVILVKTVRLDGRLRMEVHDNGTGPTPPPRPRSRQGVGVRNTRARLEQLYGAEARLELSHCPIGGTVAAVEIPFRTAAAPATAHHSLEVAA
ncbi:MAG TPA: histidine kinase [Longimicrobium sp.]|nr:histidine kinase [Longimicrobium sp.]